MLPAQGLPIRPTPFVEPSPAFLGRLLVPVVTASRQALQVPPVEEQLAVSSVRCDVVHHCRLCAWILALVVRALAERVRPELRLT